MVSAKLSQLERGSQVEKGTRTPAEALVENLVSLGIDDLAKYRLAEMFSANQDIARDAETCADALGLHSPELTSSLLRQMAAFGVLEGVLDGRRFDSLYRWAGNSWVCRQLTWLLGISRLRDYRLLVLHALAVRSFRRAEERARSVARQKGDEARRSPEQAYCRIGA